MKRETRELNKITVIQTHHYFMKRDLVLTKTNDDNIIICYSVYSMLEEIK